MYTSDRRQRPFASALITTVFRLHHGMVTTTEQGTEDNEQKKRTRLATKATQPLLAAEFDVIVYHDARFFDRYALQCNDLHQNHGSAGRETSSFVVWLKTYTSVRTGDGIVLYH